MRVRPCADGPGGTGIKPELPIWVGDTAHPPGFGLNRAGGYTEYDSQ